MQCKCLQTSAATVENAKSDEKTALARFSALFCTIPSLAHRSVARYFYLKINPHNSCYNYPPRHKFSFLHAVFVLIFRVLSSLLRRTFSQAWFQRGQEDVLISASHHACSHCTARQRPLPHKEHILPAGMQDISSQHCPFLSLHSESLLPSEKERVSGLCFSHTGHFFGSS